MTVLSLTPIMSREARRTVSIRSLCSALYFFFIVLPLLNLHIIEILAKIAGTRIIFICPVRWVPTRYASFPVRALQFFISRSASSEGQSSG